MIDQRPANGGGSCARCGAALDLASCKAGDVWYCGSSCALGAEDASPREVRVPEPWLYARPRRHFRPRRPKELRETRQG